MIEPIVTGVPLGHCDRCGSLCGIDDDGLEVKHVLACGRVCELTAAHDDYDTCDGGCHACRKAFYGCGGLREACGRKGCTQCGTHADDGTGHTYCRVAPPSRKVAWTWAGVTCEGCLARKPADVETGASP